MGFVAQLIGEILKSLLNEFLTFWMTKQAGKKEQALADSKAGRVLDQQIVDARDSQLHPHVDAQWLSRSGSTAPPPDPASAHPTSAD